MEYFTEGKWVGSGSEAYCQSANLLREELIMRPSDLIVTVNITTETGLVVLKETSDFDITETPELGQFGTCFSAKMPKNLRISNMFIQGVEGLNVKIHTPGNTYNEDNKFKHVLNRKQTDTDIEHEIFEVIDFEGDKCQNYGPDDSRDKCLNRFSVRKMLELVNCTAPFLMDKSNICTDKEKAEAALKMFMGGKGLAFADSVPECPKPCKFILPTFGGTMIDDLDESNPDYQPTANLFLRFQRYIFEHKFLTAKLRK